MLVGRKKELKILNEALNSEYSTFIAVYGRRRIGKTFLIREAYKGKISFSHTGALNTKKKDQLELFASSLRKYGYKDFKTPNNWFSAFEILENYIDTLSNDKKIIFLDELSWLDTKNSGFLPALEYFYNGWCSERDDIILVVCASSASWMLNNILNNTGGLYRRINYKIKLDYFTLQECEEYLKSKNIYLQRIQILHLYMILGGVPYYWSLLEKGLSPADNIDKLFFDKNPLLANEFEFLFKSIFKNYKGYEKIIYALSTKRMGLTRSEIISISKIVGNGALTEKLNILELCGFIRKYYQYKIAENKAIYQLTDNFTLFYYHFLNKQSNDIHFWKNNIGNSIINSWSGFSFEIVCFEHLDQIKKALGISGVSTNAITFRCSENKELGIKGSQIDLLLDRKDRVINICECKYSSGEFVMNKNTLDDLNRKRNDFILDTKTKSSCFLTLITTNGLAYNTYSSSIDNVITLDDLFE